MALSLVESVFRCYYAGAPEALEMVLKLNATSNLPAKTFVILLLNFNHTMLHETFNEASIS